MSHLIYKEYYIIIIPDVYSGLSNPIKKIAKIKIKMVKCPNSLHVKIECSITN